MRTNINLVLTLITEIGVGGVTLEWLDTLASKTSFPLLPINP
jgi:hypothetical protein